MRRKSPKLRTLPVSDQPRLQQILSRILDNSRLYMLYWVLLCSRVRPYCSRLSSKRYLRNYQFRKRGIRGGRDKIGRPCRVGNLRYGIQRTYSLGRLPLFLSGTNRPQHAPDATLCQYVRECWKRIKHYPLGVSFGITNTSTTDCVEQWPLQGILVLDTTLDLSIVPDLPLQSRVSRQGRWRSHPFQVHACSIHRHLHLPVAILRVTAVGMAECAPTVPKTN